MSVKPTGDQRLKLLIHTALVAAEVLHDRGCERTATVLKNHATSAKEAIEKPRTYATVVPAGACVSAGEVLHIARTCTPEVLAKSLQDCHAKGVDSIVIDDDHGRLTRVFISHRPLMEVGIHDHRYPLRLHALKGEVLNLAYEHATAGQLFSRWRFGPRGSAIRRDGSMVVRLKEARSLWDGPIELQAHHLHTVWAQGGSAWLVEELDVGHDGETTLLSDDEPITEGLYVPHPSPLETLERVLA